MDKKILAGNLLKIAKELVADDETEREMQKWEKKFADFVLENTAESAMKYAALCMEWNHRFPEYFPPVPGGINMPPATREDAKQRRLKKDGPRTLR